jgi:hypothetical protein
MVISRSTPYIPHSLGEFWMGGHPQTPRQKGFWLFEV